MRRDCKAGLSRSSSVGIIESVMSSYTFIVVESAAAWSHEAVMTNMGQCCVAGSRTFVHEKIYDKFVAKSRELGQKRTYGDPYEMTTKNGPQVRKVRLYDCVQASEATVISVTRISNHRDIHYTVNSSFSISHLATKVTGLCSRS